MIVTTTLTTNFRAVWIAARLAPVLKGPLSPRPKPASNFGQGNSTGIGTGYPIFALSVTGIQFKARIPFRKLSEETTGKSWPRDESSRSSDRPECNSFVGMRLTVCRAERLTRVATRKRRDDADAGSTPAAHNSFNSGSVDGHAGMQELPDEACRAYLPEIVAGQGMSRERRVSRYQARPAVEQFERQVMIT